MPGRLSGETCRRMARGRTDASVAVRLQRSDAAPHQVAPSLTKKLEVEEVYPIGSLAPECEESVPLTHGLQSLDNNEETLLLYVDHPPLSFHPGVCGSAHV